MKTTPSFGRSDRPPLSSRIRGRTFRWTWSEGPVKGSSHEHEFHTDGSVAWRCTDGARKGDSGIEKSYSAVPVADDIEVLSYLSSSGWTLTVVLNFRDHTMVGFASRGKDWSPCEGTFEEVY